MPVFIRERTARKPHRCEQCLNRIDPGQRYEAYTIAPNSDLGNVKWLRGQRHLTRDECFPRRS